MNCSHIHHIVVHESVYLALVGYEDILFQHVERNFKQVTKYSVRKRAKTESHCYVIKMVDLNIIDFLQFHF